MTIGSYFLELDRWNIKNDGTEALNTTKGLNDALTWAAQQGIVEVVLPTGIYLIDENNPIKPKSFMTLNLGGSTLKIRDNGLTKYSIISFQDNQKYSRITNGKIEGDKETHDYSSGGTHEGGYGIQIGSFTPSVQGGNNTRFISIDNLEIYNCTGDAITVNSTFGQISPIPTSLASSWEQGGISTTDGKLTVNNSKIRSTLKIPMNQQAILKYGYFGLYGNGYGDLGPDIICDYYDIIFYRSNDTFLVSRKQVQFFDEVELPIGASYAKVVLHQSKIPALGKSLINVRVPSFPQHTYIEKCDLHHCRRQGISISGTKHIYIRDNHIHHIRGTNPQSGIDVEDGYDLNQFIYIERNNFHDNYFYDVVVVNGKVIYLEGNRFSSTTAGGPSLAVNGGADKVFINKNNLHNTKAILSGNITFSDNNLFATQLSVLGAYYNRPINISNNIFHNSKLVVDNPFSYLVKIDGCRFFNDTDKINAFSNFLWTLELKNEPQIISNCTFEGQDFYYLTYTNMTTFKGGWIFENTTFKNVKNPSLFAGTYSNCKFLDVNFVGVYGNITETLNLIGCNFISNDSNNLLTVNNLKSLIIKNCSFEKPNGVILKIQNITDSVILTGNMIKVINDTLYRPLVQIESFYGNLIVIENNYLSAKNLAQIGLQYKTINNPLIAIRNNILQKATIASTGNEIIQNNIIDGINNP